MSMFILISISIFYIYIYVRIYVFICIFIFASVFIASFCMLETWNQGFPTNKTLFWMTCAG